LVCGAIAINWIVLPAFLTTMGYLSTDIINGTCIPLGVYSSYAVQKTVIASMICVVYLFPMMLMLFCYCRIVYALKQKVG